MNNKINNMNYYKNYICMNAGSECGCAGHCPYWKPTNTESNGGK